MDQHTSTSTSTSHIHHIMTTSHHEPIIRTVIIDQHNPVNVSSHSAVVASLNIEGGPENITQEKQLMLTKVKPNCKRQTMHSAMML